MTPNPSSQESGGAWGRHTVVGESSFPDEHFPEYVYNFCDIGSNYEYTHPIYPLSVHISLRLFIIFHGGVQKFLIAKHTHQWVSPTRVDS